MKKPSERVLDIAMRLTEESYVAFEASKTGLYDCVIAANLGAGIALNVMSTILRKTVEELKAEEEKQEQEAGL